VADRLAAPCHGGGRIPRNRWADKIGTGGRIKSESVGASARNTHFGPNLAVGIAFDLLKIGRRTPIPNYRSDTQLCGRPSLSSLRPLRAVNFQGVMPISFALAAIGAGIVGGGTDWDADCGLRQRGNHDPDRCEVDMG